MVAAPVLNDRQFGILIAYVIPGFVVVHGLSYHSPAVAAWLGPGQQPTVAGFFYVTLASIACGLVISTSRWLVVDPLLHFTGVQKTQWTCSMLREQLPAFEMFVLYTYRYYQFHANLIVALPVWFLLRWLNGQTASNRLLVLMAVIEVVLIAGARDTLSKYNERTNQLLREPKLKSRIVIP